MKSLSSFRRGVNETIISFYKKAEQGENNPEGGWGKRRLRAELPNFTRVPRDHPEPKQMSRGNV